LTRLVVALLGRLHASVQVRRAAWPPSGGRTRTRERVAAYHRPVRFYLGTPCADWLSRRDLEGVPLFVSANRLRGHAEETRATMRWALDSGGFTQIAAHGRWVVPAKQYASEAARWRREIGRMDFAAIQDYMCEPPMIEKTGLSVVIHQMLTTRSLLELRDLEPSVPWMPVLQGWEMEDYLRHADRYDRAGVDLTKEPVVGVGSVCRRENTAEAELLMKALHRLSIKPHGFGFKKTGVVNAGRYMHSADSMAWSYAARFRPVRLKECAHEYRTCEYCDRWALRWRRELHRALSRTI
jgi:hypothetical protein